jgi:uncharacterized membrane protein
MAFEWDAYKALVFLHVAAIVIALGSTFALPVLQPMAAHQGIPALRFALRFTHRLEQVIVGPGSGIALLTGIALIFNDRTGYKDDFPTWLLISAVWFVVAAVVANTFQARNVRRAIELVEATPDAGPPPAELGPEAKRKQLTGQLLAHSTIGIKYLMVGKPN